MADSTVAIDSLKSFEVALNLATQIPFNRKPARADGLDDLVQLLSAQILRANIRADIRLLEDSFRR